MTITALAPSEKINQPRVAESAKFSWSRIIIQTVMVTILAVISLEFVFSAAGIGEEEYLKPDPITGADGIPNKSVTFRKEGFGRFRYNSFGMQDAERAPAKQLGTFRVACLGDSLTEALQVDRQANFCSLLERKLTQAKQQNCEVLNFGVSNSSIGQMYLRLKNKVWKFQPDVVALCIRPDSVYQLAPNPQGGFIYARPSFFLDAKGNLIQDMTVQRLWEKSRDGKRMRATGWLREHSHIWGVVSKGVEQFSAWLEQARKGTAQWGADVTDKQTAFNAQSDTAPSPAAIPNKASEKSTEKPTGKPAEKTTGTAETAAETPSKAPSEAPTSAPTSAPHIDRSYYNKATDYFWPTAQKLLEEIALECERHNAKLMIVRLPSYDGWRNDHETELLKQTAQRVHADFVDTQPGFAKAAKTESLFFDAHMRASGHKIVAESMAKAFTF